MKKILSFLTLLCAIFSFAANYYWVGGSGNWTDINHWRTTSGGSSLPSVIPGPTDNVFFDSKSGFTTTSKTITLDNTGNCHNITFSGSTTSPIVTQSGSQTLNIYGSSEWQAGMGTLNISYIYYRNTGEAKTIKSNGVKTVTGGYLYFEEENSISLLDDFEVGNILYQQAGTWNTNNYKVTIGNYFQTNFGTNKPTTLNLGSSHIYMIHPYANFNTNGYTTINAGTSHIHFTQIMGGNGLVANASQTFYDVTFEGPYGKVSGGAKFNRTEFKQNGQISGSNTYKELIFSAGKTYTLESGKTQWISCKCYSNIL